MKHTSDYGIFINKRTSKKLAYYPVKKNANSSSKLFFLKHLGLENQFYFIEDDLPRYKHTKEMYDKYKGKNNIVGFLPSVPFKKINVDEKCCIIRDPLKRFVSSYKNRILFHKDKKFFKHNINLILEKLENNLFENEHFLPQSYWLGKDLNYYTIIGKLPNIRSFVDQINKFFQQEHFFPKIQTGGREFQISLNLSQINKLKKIYADDYDLIGNLL